MTFYLSKEPAMATSTYGKKAYVLIFKTNVHLKKDLRTIEVCLQEHNSILNWNIDREDIDKVLRIESTIDNTEEIIKTIRQAGYFCEELD